MNSYIVFGPGRNVDECITGRRKYEKIKTGGSFQTAEEGDIC